MTKITRNHQTTPTKIYSYFDFPKKDQYNSITEYKKEYQNKKGNGQKKIIEIIIENFLTTDFLDFSIRRNTEKK